MVTPLLYESGSMAALCEDLVDKVQAFVGQEVSGCTLTHAVLIDNLYDGFRIGLQHRFPLLHRR